MKVALAFFGITRSLKYTIESIQSNILDVFKNNTIEYDIFMHTYSLTNYKNIRTNECTDIYDNTEYKLLNAKYLEIDDQNTITKQIDMTQYRTHKDPWDTRYNSVDNFILAQYSKSKVVSMIHTTNIKYDYIIFIRPDCRYLQKFDMSFFDKVNDTTILIPDFHLYEPYKFNDRFCITTNATYKIYGDTFNLLLNISKKEPLHSETVLYKIIVAAKIDIIRVKFYFARIRCNGERDFRDHF
jgi:hypothetical protein